MVSQPVVTPLDGDITAIVELPLTTMKVVVASAQCAIFLNHNEQDRLRMLLEVSATTCDEVLDPAEPAGDQVRCVLRPAQLTLVQGVVSCTLRGSAARNALLGVLRKNTIGDGLDDFSGF